MNTQPPNSTEELPIKTKRPLSGWFRWMTLFATTGAVVTGLLALGIMPRLHQQAELNAIAKSIETDFPTVNVVRPNPASNNTELLLPASIQADQ